MKPYRKFKDYTDGLAYAGGRMIQRRGLTPRGYFAFNLRNWDKMPPREKKLTLLGMKDEKVTEK